MQTGFRGDARFPLYKTCLFVYNEKGYARWNCFGM